MTKLAELRAKRAKIDQEIAEEEEAAKVDVKAQIDNLLAENGFEIGDLFPQLSAAKNPATKTTGGARSFKLPCSDEVFKDRGPQKQAVKDFLASGGTKADYIWID